MKKVFIAYDHDQAGDAAADKLAAELSAQGAECLRVTFPYGTDANDAAVAADDPRRELGQLLARARWISGPPAFSPRPRRSLTAPANDATNALPNGTADGPADSSAAAPSEPSGASAFQTANVDLTPSAFAVAAAHDELVVETGGHRWRVRHIPKAPTPGALRVNLMVGSGERFHVDTVDLYAARARAGFADAAATELRCQPEQLKEELGRVMLATEDAQAAAAAAPIKTGPAPMSAAEREAALELLCSPDLLERVGSAFGALGVVGERDGALAAWLTLTSRLSDRPLGAVVQSSSAAGKSTLADAALSLVPPEAKVAYSAMTGQALYYLGNADLAHKVLAIAEEEGASRASYPLKLLVSEGRLSIAAAGKDPSTGKLVTHTYEVSGPVALLMTTTSAKLDR